VLGGVRSVFQTSLPYKITMCEIMMLNFAVFSRMKEGGKTVAIIFIVSCNPRKKLSIIIRAQKIKTKNSVAYDLL